jgi:O-antigen/teichoic acid export membrane protein
MKFNLDRLQGKYAKNLIPKIRHWRQQFIPSDLIQKVVETFSTRIFLIIASLVTSVIIARSLGPEGRGLYALALTVGMIGVQFSNFGLHSSNTFYIAKNPGLLPPLLGNSLAVGFVAGSFFAGTAGLVFHFLPGIAPIQGSLLFLSLAWIPFSLVFLLTQNLLIGIQEIRSYNKIEIINKTLSILLITIIVFANWSSAESIFLSALIALIFSTVLIFQNLIKHLSRPLHLSFILFKRNLPYGIKSYLGSFIAFLLLRVDLLMVDRILGKKETGFYDIAINLSEMVYLLPLVVSMILFPKLCAIQNNREKWELSKNVGKALLIIMLLLCGLAALVAYPAVEILYGKAFLACVPAFIILAISKVIMSITSIFSNFVASIHVPWTTVPFGFFILGVNILLNLIFIKEMGLVGAALASVISFSLLIPFHYFYAMKHLNSNQISSS